MNPSNNDYWVLLPTVPTRTRIQTSNFTHVSDFLGRRRPGVVPKPSLNENPVGGMRVESWRVT